MKEKILSGKRVYRKTDGKLVGMIDAIYTDIEKQTIDGITVAILHKNGIDYESIRSMSLDVFQNEYTTDVPKTLWEIEHNVQEPKIVGGAAEREHRMTEYSLRAAMRYGQEPKIEKRKRLDILQDLTDQGAKWGLATNPATPSRIQASVMGNDDDEEFDDIRKAIDWIIEQICPSEKGS